MQSEKVKKYIKEHGFCSECLFRDWEQFLDLLYAEGGRVSSMLWWDRCRKDRQRFSPGSGGYTDPEDDEMMYAETQLYSQDMELFSLDELKGYIKDQIRTGICSGKYQSSELVPSFYLAGEDDPLQMELRGEELFFSHDGEEYMLASQPYEPMLYICRGDETVCSLHNAFNVRDLIGRFREGGTVEDMRHGTYDEAAFCRVLEAALDSGRSDMDFDFAAQLVSGSPVPGGKRAWIRELSLDDKEMIKQLFTEVFTGEPWNDDWSNAQQLDDYITELIGQSNSLTLAYSENGVIEALSMGRIKHWYTGTEYFIDELFTVKEFQHRGKGTKFLEAMGPYLMKKGIVQLYLQTDRNVPAYDFYIKNGFRPLEDDVALWKDLNE